MRTITINVDQNCIDKGIQENHLCCPIALACRVAGMPVPSITNGKCYKNYPDLTENGIPLPPEAIAFYQAFDRGEEVKPFSFNLEINND